MPQIMKVKCNDPALHVNDIDLDKVMRPTPAFRSRSKPAQPNIPERLVLPCQHCTTGKVIITRDMIAAFQSQSKAQEGE